jgi:hypothetical protein
MLAQSAYHYPPFQAKCLCSDASLRSNLQTGASFQACPPRSHPRNFVADLQIDKLPASILQASSQKTSRGAKREKAVGGHPGRRRKKAEEGGISGPAPRLTPPAKNPLTKKTFVARSDTRQHFCCSDPLKIRLIPFFAVQQSGDICTQPASPATIGADCATLAIISIIGRILSIPRRRRRDIFADPKT